MGSTNVRVAGAVLALLASLVVVAGSAAGGPSKVLLADDFTQGFSLGGTGTWQYLIFPPFVSDDGITSTSNRGLYVKASGTNPVTGEPAFTKQTPGSDFDHVKWMADANHFASTGFPGYDATPGQEVQCSMWARGQTFGTAANPFGAPAVSN